jgi:glutathione synthase/RimK-type ligase-like ATP-grasp enzyme
MISFGMMSLNMNSELSYFTEIAQRAEPALFTCYRFSPSHIHPVTQRVQGDRYDCQKDKWVKDDFPVPQILYDRCFYTDDLISKQSMAIVKWLKSRNDLLFLGSGLPNKWDIYQALSSSELSPYIPVTDKAANGKKVIDQLKSWKKAILKPAFGSGGAGIYSIEKQGRMYLVSADHGGKLAERSFPSESETEDWLNRLFKRDYLMQPYLDLRDSMGRPFDIRILLQKNHSGQWTFRGKGIRRGNVDGILSNLSAGGEIISFDEFANSLDQKTKRFIKSELDDIIFKLPEILETSFPRLFELGIDIGVSKNHALWVLDTNSKPGRKVLLNTNPELADILYKAPLDHALFLAKKLIEREEQHL